MHASGWCDNSRHAVAVTERIPRPHVLAFTRRFSVMLTCTTQTRSWTPAARFRHGRYSVTLRAADRSGALEPARARSLVL